MKTKILLFIFGVLTSMSLFSQVPEKFNYQGVLRNTSGELVKNTNITVKISLLQASSTGELKYSEGHSVTTNNYGQFNVKVGSGNILSGSFTTIDWSTEMYIKTEVANPVSGTLVDMGTFQLISVPYSLYSDKAKTIDKSTLYFTDNDTLFAVKDRQGNVIFAVFPDGAKVIVDQATKGAIGGFAVSGRTPAKEGEMDYFRVTLDSTRIYLNDTASIKGSVGGFAVSGRTPAKGLERDYLFVTPDSTRVTFNTNSKGNVGGFAVSGRTPSKGNVNSLLNLFPDNYFIGHESGVKISTGILNSTLGYESGLNLLTGSNNSFLGYQSGYSTEDGSGNLFLGYQSGFSNVIGNYNTFLGYQAGYANNDGTNNSFLGSFTGKNNIGGSYNTFIGDSTGFNNTNGSNNSFIGTKVGFNNDLGSRNSFFGNYAGYSNKGGFENVFIGDHSGYSNLASGMNVSIGVRSGYYGENGWNNVYLGTETGYNNIDGEGNVFIGYQTGMNNTHGARNIFIGNRAGMDQQGSDRLIIDNKDEDSTKTFIWGNLQADLLRFNAHIGIGTNPDYNDLAIYRSNGSASISIMGIDDSFNYAQLKLDADIGTDTTSYIMTHDTDHRYRIIYFDGNTWFPRIGIDAAGKVMIGGPWVDATEMLDVDGNARIRSIASGTYLGAVNRTADGTFTTSTSDIRLKENVATLSNGLNKVMQLRGVNFNWKSDENKTTKIGFIAQEVQKVIPELVFENPTDGYLGVNYAEMTAVLVEAVKEQQNQIENLTKLNQQLIERITNLENERK